MYLQSWPGASLLGFNLIQFQQMRSESWDRRQITQACVFEVFTVRTGMHCGEEKGGSGSESVSVGVCVYVFLCVYLCQIRERGAELER